jgi:hypothetical protein
MSYSLKNRSIQEVRRQNTPQPRCLVVVRLPQRYRLGLGCLGFQAISAVFISHMVRSTAYGYKTVRGRFGYLCVRRLTLPG